MSENLSSLPEPTGGPSFDKFDMIMKYDKQKNIIPNFNSVVDLKALNAIGEVLYYETIFSPVLTVSITIVNSNPKVKIFEDYSILGGEVIRFTINDLMSQDDPFKGIVFEGIVNSVDSYSSNNFAEIFRIKATTAWVSKSGVSGTVTGNPTEIVKKLLKGSIETSGGTWKDDYLYSDQATNKITLNLAQEKKDNALAVCMRLASLSEYNKSAGFLFWRTKVAYNFRAIDSMIADGKTGDQDPLGVTYSYTYKGLNPGQEMISGEDGSSLTALRFNVQTTDYSVKKQVNVTGDTTFVTFDPIRYDFHESYQLNPKSQFGFSTLKDTNFYEVSPDALSKQNFAKSLDFQGMTFTNTFDCTLNENPHKGKTISKARYSSLLDVSAIMVVPLNTSLIAGSCVNVEIPRTIHKQDCSFEDEVVSSEYSGLYIIAAVCHAMDVKKGYTSLHLVRDYGKLNEPK